MNSTAEKFEEELMQPIKRKFLEKFGKELTNQLSEQEMGAIFTRDMEYLASFHGKIHSDGTANQMAVEMIKNLEQSISSLKHAKELEDIKIAHEKYLYYDRYARGRTLAQKKGHEVEWRIARNLAEKYSEKYYKDMGMTKELLRIELLAEFLISAEDGLLIWLNNIYESKKLPLELIPYKKVIRGHFLFKKKLKRKQKRDWEKNMMYR